VSIALTFRVSWRAAAAARAVSAGFLPVEVVPADGPVELLSELLADGVALSAAELRGAGLLGAALLGSALLGAALLGAALLGGALSLEAVLPGPLGSAVSRGDADGVLGVGDPVGSARAGEVETASVAMAPTRTARGRRCMCTRNHSGR
jgi:hypothetical protein